MTIIIKTYLSPPFVVCQHGITKLMLPKTGNNSGFNANTVANLEKVDKVPRGSIAFH
tara:strand:- start:34975 stop:35145 length:171 start_codon:yes stop_codon:yes gene_type:complete